MLSAINSVFFFPLHIVFQLNGVATEMIYPLDVVVFHIIETFVSLLSESFTTMKGCKPLAFTVFIVYRYKRCTALNSSTEPVTLGQVVV